MAIIVDDGGIISWNNSTYIPHELDYRPSTRVRLDPVKSAATGCHRLLEVDPRLIKSYNTVPIAFRRTVNRLEARHCRKTSWTLPTQQNCPKNWSGSRTRAAAGNSVPTANHQNQHLFAPKTSFTYRYSKHPRTAFGGLYHSGWNRHSSFVVFQTRSSQMQDGGRPPSWKN